MMERARVNWLGDAQCSKHICSTFKQKAIQWDIHALRDQEGKLHNTWEGIVDIMRSHFINLLGTEVPLDKDMLQEVL